MSISFNTGDTMDLVFLPNFTDAYEEIYGSELQGRVSEVSADLDDESKLNMVASKIYIYCILLQVHHEGSHFREDLSLSKLGALSQIGVIGRAFYLPPIGIASDALSLRYQRVFASDAGVSRMNLGIIHLAGLGAYIIDLGGQNKVLLRDSEDKEIDFVHESDKVKLCPLFNISKIEIIAGKNDRISEEVVYHISASEFPTVSKEFSMSADVDGEADMSAFLSRVDNRSKVFLEGMGKFATDELKTAVEQVAKKTAAFINEILASYKAIKV